MKAWFARGVVAVLALVACGAVALSVVDGWRPAGGHGVPWVESLVHDEPQDRVDDYLRAIATGDREQGLALWQVPERGAEDALAALRDRRVRTTDALLAAHASGHRIVDLRWWSTCCEPHPVTSKADASVARVTVAFDGLAEKYTFDVRAVEAGRSLLDEVARRWSVSDVYRAGDEPLLLRWIAFGNGSLALGSVYPPRAVDCGVSDETAPNAYDATARDCVWSAYSMGTPSRWTVMRRTTEGDPIRATMTAQRGFIIVTRDMTADRFSAAPDRRMWTWQCRTIAKRAWATDPTRSFFDLSGCSGDGGSTAFP